MSEPNRQSPSAGGIYWGVPPLQAFRLLRGPSTMTGSPSHPTPPENLIVETDAGIAIVTVNRPKVLNALNTQTLDELRRALLALTRDDAVRVVVLTGAGEKAF